jgi:hypothetical protein
MKFFLSDVLGTGTAVAPQIAKRNVTSQGLSGIGISGGPIFFFLFLVCCCWINHLAAGTGRMIADKNFFIGELRIKIKEIQTEMAKLNKEIEQYEKENQTSLQLERK